MLAEKITKCGQSIVNEGVKVGCYSLSTATEGDLRQVPTDLVGAWDG